MSAMSEWGRIATDGTVYVKTAEGERPVGSWQAGTPEEGLAFYTRRYDDLAAEVGILEARIEAGTADPKAVTAAAGKLRAALPEAPVVGDLADLDARLAAVQDKASARLADKAAARAEAAARAADAKRALVAEAQRLSASDEWRPAGDRFRAMVEEWKGIRGVDRAVDSELWEQFAAARRDFDRRRKVHFADLDRQREEAAAAKEELVTQAEKLAASDDWAATARAYRDLMARWKAAGRAARETDDALWQRFKTAQDSFFARRAEVLAKRDEEFAGNLAAKEALLAEAESLDPGSDLEGARKRLRSIHDRWDKVGKVPRESMAVLEDRLAAVEQRVRDAGSARRPTAVPESPLVIRLRESVTKLEARLERARAAGDDKLTAETETSLATQREWLTQAESSSS
jgi:hypothetical protein